MCLITKENYRSTAKEDLTVYKLLFEDSAYYMRDFTYQKGENVPTENAPLPKPDRYGFISIREGWLHCYATKERAERTVHFLSEITPPDKMLDLRIVEMTVPKGTDYFVGIGDDEVCAKKLVWYGND